MPITQDRQYRTMTPLQIQNRSDESYIVKGLATTYNQPYLIYEYDGIKYYEEIDKNAFIGADMSDVIMQYDHRGKVFARQSNGTLTLDPFRDDGLFIKADLSKSSAARELYEEIDAGLITKMSFAFTIEEEVFNSEKRLRTITKVKKVYDVSAVSLPANPDTLISVRSFVDGVIAKEKQELLEWESKLLIAKRKFEFMR